MYEGASWRRGLNAEYERIQAYLPDMLGGWAWTPLVAFGILLLWYLAVRYNESTETFTVV